MIESQDRSGWFGASDTSKVIANNRTTKTWQKWWLIKLGILENDFVGNVYTEAGNLYEHPILKEINQDMTLDRQLKIEKRLLRVNYDGDYDGIIYEVKTHRGDKEFEISKQYWRQAQAEMYCYKECEKEFQLPPFKSLYIVSYGLNVEEYNKLDRVPVIEQDRIKMHEIEYDKNWVKSEYLPKLKELSRALRKGKLL